MARDRANIRTDMLGSDEYRDLTVAEQHLYKLLMIHSTLSYAGVAEWRPGKLAATAADLTKESVRAAGRGLQAKHFIYVDEETEEVFIRSFVRHDGLLKQFRLPVSMANDYTDISSKEIRQFFVHELRRLFDEYPEYKCWEIDRVQRLLKNKSVDMKTINYGTTQGDGYATPQATTYGNGYAEGYGIDEKQGYGLLTATATATATSTSKDVEGVNSPNVTREENTTGQTGTRIPANFTTDAHMIAWALDNAPNVNLKLSTQKFKAHYRSVAGRQQFRTDWTAAWESWMLSDQQRAADKPQQFKSAAERSLEAGAALHAKYSAIEEQNQLALEEHHESA